jgi:hypothetical protein
MMCIYDDGCSFQDLHKLSGSSSSACLFESLTVGNEYVSVKITYYVM